MAWLWNTNIADVLMIGLGGASAQRSFERLYPSVTIDTAELDAAVIALARQFFHYRTSARQRVYESDGRQFLRRSRRTYDLVVMDAYSKNRYGSYLPHHLTTREFFELAAGRMSEEGVLCYNVMGTFQGEGAAVVAAIYKTMKAVFPQVYLFLTGESRNVVLVGTRSKAPVSFSELRQRATRWSRTAGTAAPKLQEQVYKFRGQAPPASSGVPVLTDDYAPVDRLMQVQPHVDP
jgi:spermidine synthase